MAKKKIRNKVYHCDGYYFRGVCQFRGTEDVADVHYSRSGLLVAPNFVCSNDGLDKKDRLCPHCIENKTYFPADLVKVRLSSPQGRVVSLTPYQAKDENAKTIRAFTKPKNLSDFLKTRPDLYGVDANSGEPIGVEIESG